MLEESVKALKETYKDRGVEEDGDGGAADPFAPMLRALQAEIKQYREEVLTPHFKIYIDAVTAGTPYSSPYGPELGEGNDARYEFWPPRAASCPSSARR